jgi:hypothetical protein
MLTIAAYNFKAILEGALTFVPGGEKLLAVGTRGTDTARYCYSVWMRHLLRTASYRTAPLDGRVVELGPGDSLGIGLAALLSGADQYIAVDAVRHANADRNIAVLDELFDLFAGRASIPDDEEFPDIKPRLNGSRFPEELLDAARMKRNLAQPRLRAIRDALLGVSMGDPPVQYVDPSMAATAVSSGSVSLVFSQAVLEHVDDLASVYRQCHQWLRADGLMSHQIDFKSHGSSREWNGHWAYPEPVWRVLRGRRPYLLNREPWSSHRRLLLDSGFEILEHESVRLPTRLRRSQLADCFRDMNEEDFTTAGVFLVAKKRTM